MHAWQGRINACSYLLDIPDNIPRRNDRPCQTGPNEPGADLRPPWRNSCNGSHSSDCDPLNAFPMLSCVPGYCSPAHAGLHRPEDADTNATGSSSISLARACNACRYLYQRQHKRSAHRLPSEPSAALRDIFSSASTPYFPKNVPWVRSRMWPRPAAGIGTPSSPPRFLSCALHSSRRVIIQISSTICIIPTRPFKGHTLRVFT